MTTDEKGAYGRITIRMERSPRSSTIHPPKLIPSFVAGFNAIASHVYLVIFPICLDVLLWFGPLVRIKNIMLPILESSLEQMRGIYAAETMQLMEASKDTVSDVLGQLNLLFGLRTFPIGIPSLMVGLVPLNNPLGSLSAMELNSFSSAFLLLLLLALTGVVMGSIFFSLVARTANPHGKDQPKINLFQQIQQSMLLFLLALLLLTGLAFPSMCFLSSIGMFLPNLGVIPIYILGVVLVWMLLPLVFSAHGIFVTQSKAWPSITTSIRLVRRYLPGTGMFFLIAILLSQGLDLLWATPETSSWLMAIGILGHAFIASGVLAASFVYYAKGLEWMQEVQRRVEAQKQKIEPPQAS
jgi:hypothetical protein